MKIICIGRNYADHIKELKNDRPTEPVIFMKPDTALIKNNQPFYYPSFSNDIHYEVEVLLRVSKQAKFIEKEYALDYINGIGLGIDFTARDLQSKYKEKGLPWEKAKAFNGSAPISNFISSVGKELGDLNFSLKVNGEERQKGNTSLMLWKIDELLSYISQFFSLQTGDIIFTGTPKGVGPVKIGDVLEGFLEGESMFRFEVK